MTDEELQAIQARVDAATPGPWEWSRSYDVGLGRGSRWCIVAPGESPSGTCLYPLVSIASDPTWAFQADPLFLAHARTDVPVLLDEVRRLRAELAYCEQILADALNGGEMAQYEAGRRRGLEQAAKVVADCFWGTVTEVTEKILALRDARFVDAT